MYNLFACHHILPGEFWALPKGEQLMLIAFSDFEIKDHEKWTKGGIKKSG